MHLGFHVTHFGENVDVDFMKHEEEDEDGQKQEEKGSG